MLARGRGIRRITVIGAAYGESIMQKLLSAKQLKVGVHIPVEVVWLAGAASTSFWPGLRGGIDLKSFRSWALAFSRGTRGVLRAGGLII
jgi:hypothetical protein